MITDLTKGNETKVILLFAIPMIIGNLFQQLYNVVDTIIVGKFIGSNALAAVGSSYTLVVFLTSIILGLCMGSGVVFSFYFGAKEVEKLKASFLLSFFFILFFSIFINLIVLFFMDFILQLIQIPEDVYEDTKQYLMIICSGILFTFVYNYFSSVLRSMGNSVIPLIVLVISAILNIILDIIFVVPFKMGIAGAAFATILSQAVSAVFITGYSFLRVKEIHISKKVFSYCSWDIMKKIMNYSILTSIQQSIMNFGILMIQGLVNSFGVTVMAGFAAAVKIDNFAYMPVQDFGNAFSTYIAQNTGAKKQQRVQKGIVSTVKFITLFCIFISIIVVCFSKQLLLIFIKAKEIQVIAVGIQYLHIVAAFYCLIGYLFMFYGLYRGLGKAQMSIVLTIISLGTRVILAYILSPIPAIGLQGIWWAIPIGWLLADIVGLLYYKKMQKKNKIKTFL